jgi:hypothetical protein
MSNFAHIVYVHPVENGLPDLNKVELGRKFDTKKDADQWVKIFNYTDIEYEDVIKYRAVYYGCVNDETGELV